MHVGVYVPNLPEQSGGAYTLEHDLFEALFAEGLSSRHRFTGLVESNRGHSAYPTLLLPKAWLVKRILRKVRLLLEEAAKRLGIVKKNRSIHWFDALLAKNGIEFVISLDSRMRWTFQPYLIFAMDLEHRNQPYFPEVTGAEWHMREKHYYRVLGHAAFVITGTRAGAAELERFFGVSPKRIRVIPFPTPQFALEPPPSPDEPEEPLPQLAADIPFLFYPAQFWAHKNHVTILKVLKELRDRHQLNVTLVLVGSDMGNWHHVKNWIRRLELEKDVVCPGFVSRPQLRWLYRNALALIFPTLFGPDNLPPLEAFALGCPVIASAVDGAVEQLGDAAILCNPVDVHGYAEACVTILKDPSLRTELIQRGKARAAQWTRRDAAKSLVGILDEFEAVRDNWGAIASQHFSG